MRILYLNPAGALGGAERALLDLIASLRTAHPRWEIALIAAAEGLFAEEARGLGIKTTVLPFPQGLAAAGDAGAGGPAGNHTGRWCLLRRLGLASPAIAMFVHRLGRAINQTAPDLVHTNGFKMHVLGAWASPHRVPLVWHIHDFVRVRPLMSRLLRIHSKRCAAVIANSRSVADDVRAVLGSRIPVHVVYNAVDLDRFSPQGPKLDLDALCEMSAADRGIIRVGLVATMARWKGHQAFLRALAMLPADLPVRGYVIGGPVYDTLGSQHDIEELKNLAAELGIAHKVGFTGLVRDSAAALRALDIVVHASVAPEPFGLVIAEAFACGRAVIASAAGGVSEIITPGENALAHRPGDVVGLARCIVQLAGDRELRVRLATAACGTARRRFTRARLAIDLNTIYRALASDFERVDKYAAFARP
jgi:glycosyltransferase involved in cell wall biosynthesis